jgi:hypothetical protein
MSRQIYAVCLKCLFSLVLLLSIGLPALGQSSSSAAVNGVVQDTTDARIPNANVKLINTDTGTESNSKTNKDGIFTVPSVLPGHYRLQIEREGFDTTQLTAITLNVGDNKEVIIRMKVGSPQQTVTVDASGLTLNTTDASVSTVIDRQFVENMPLNGRSFQDLILLTPGVVTNTPQNGNSAVGGAGEFSVNGQRTESNVYSVDGVSANVGISPGSTTSPSTGGSLPASTALGTTQAIVSVDALQEFRVQSSTYSAEYGRSPGGQFNFETRAGTNKWHGTAFDYLRNGYFDANDWFNDYLGAPQLDVHQNDFGGTLGGPVSVPHLYSGKDKTFFFFSYEGLRVSQPQAAMLYIVPNNYVRTCASAALRPLLNALAQPNVQGPAPDCANPDPGNGVADFVGSWSNPSQLDAYSVRLDHTVNDKLKLFFRFGSTPSSTASRIVGPTIEDITTFTSRTYTGGATYLFSSRITNDFRLNYSSNQSSDNEQLVSFAGGQAADLVNLQGFATGSNQHPSVEAFFILPGGDALASQGVLSGNQSQWNIVDTVTLSHGRHLFKFGVDYRRLTPFQAPASPEAIYEFLGESQVLNNTPGIVEGITTAAAYPLYMNFSVFAQDEWKLTRRLNLSMGVRWDVNPAPGSTRGKSNLPYTALGDSLATLTLAPQGTPLWQTSWYNFAPRLGAVYQLRDKPGQETVIRAGAGVFYDTGQQVGSRGYEGDGFQAVARVANASFPAPPAALTPAITNPPVPPYNEIFAFPAHMQLPYTLQWNVSAQQALGKQQTLTVSYVGAAGRRLLGQQEIEPGAVNPNFDTILMNQNGLTSDYDALQLQWQRALSHGLSVLASYTWSHSIDDGSQSIAFPSMRGNSDFDVRQNFSTAISYSTPDYFEGKLTKALLDHWGLDDRFTARTAFPVTPVGPRFVDPATGQINPGELNLVPGQPLYLYGANCATVLQGLGNLSPGQTCPGGRAINPHAFALPAGCTEFSCSGPISGNAPRNLVRGFGEWQMDLAVRREFPLYDRLHLQFRAEAFNIFNHPNFGEIDPEYSDLQFGQAEGTLASTLGVVSPLYQTGGPRSMQFALKLIF